MTNSWNCQVRGVVQKASATIKAQVYRVSGDAKTDAVVKAGARVAELFKAFAPFHADAEVTALLQPAIRAERDLTELPTWEALFTIECGAAETRLEVSIEVHARSEASAGALAAAMLGRQLAGDLELLEFVHLQVKFVRAAPQLQLFGTRKKLEELPLAAVPQGTPSGDVCECGHHIGRHAGTLDAGTGESPGACSACVVTLPENMAERCKAFCSRDVEELRGRVLARLATTPRIVGVADVHDDAPPGIIVVGKAPASEVFSGDELEVVPGAAGEPDRVRPTKAARRRRRARSDSEDAASAPTPPAGTVGRAGAPE